MKNENDALKQQMQSEFESLREQNQIELDQQKEEAEESIAILRQSLQDQSEEMKKFGDFIKQQAETVKV